MRHASSWERRCRLTVTILVTGAIVVFWVVLAVYVFVVVVICSTKVAQTTEVG